jgi:hypothetical protein
MHISYYTAVLVLLFSNLLKARSATMVLKKRLRTSICLEFEENTSFSDKINFNVDVCGRSDVTS